MRLFAALALLAASLLFGYSLVASDRRALRLLRSLIDSLGLMRSEISARLTPIPDCAAMLSTTGSVECRAFYSALAAALDALGELEFSSIWSAAVRTLELPAEARAALDVLGASLGRYNAAEQCAAIDLCAERLRRINDDMERRMAASTRLKLALPACAALLVGVLLY